MSKEITDQEIKECSKEVFSHWNEKHKRRFDVRSKANYEFIKTLLNKGYRALDIKKVIDEKTRQWKKVSTMKSYLKPSVILFIHNFHRYHNSLNSSGK